MTKISENLKKKKKHTFKKLRICQEVGLIKKSTSLIQQLKQTD